MMTANEIRKTFLDFFASKGHKIVPSAPLVNKDDPTLMFINAGMNQFKDYFLGNQTPDNPRIADTQKCLRVSGKHNDLEEVGRDSYHHTMFEMLGNWSFGDYFKREAIDWAWELLTEVYKIPKDRLYVSVFAGEASEGLAADEEAVQMWTDHIDKDRILYFDKSDNFWEMGDTGPCGPCSEIHVDIRSDEERAKVDGKSLVNADHPQVVEIWNLVFIQFNRKADGSLEELPAKHIDTGMGLERLIMALQGKTSNYDTDMFTPFIAAIEKASGVKYTFSYEESAMTDIAMRVIADHIRAVAFAIADGQLPSNNGAGYVIRRILRRAVRYYYSFLNIKDPFLATLVPLLANHFADTFPELKAQEEQVRKIIEGEEKTFLKTLERGLKRFDNLEVTNNTIAGKDAFQLYDTYGFPIDLTRLMAEEKGWSVDEDSFKAALDEQKNRARKDAEKSVGDWVDLMTDVSSAFVGYDNLEVDDAKIIKYRIVHVKKKEQYQVVLDTTPFYAESGGQAGDTGKIWVDGEEIAVYDTQKENDLTIHLVKKLPENPAGTVIAKVNAGRRDKVSKNHSAAHLMHAALHEVLGQNATQKGQDVNDKRLRFDFANSQKVTTEELQQIEDIVNAKVRENIALKEERDLPIKEAEASGALMLFGEKYGETVRVITFGDEFSKELCGGTHVAATGEIGLFKIVVETSVAAGIRRIEAVTAEDAETYVNAQLEELTAIRTLLKNPKDATKQVESLQEENRQLKKEIEKMMAAQAAALQGQLKSQFEEINGINFLATKLPLTDAGATKTLAFQLEKEVGNAVIAFGIESNGKPQLMVMISKDLAESKGLNAGAMVREMAKEIKGGGGGQAFFATAGGKDATGLAAGIAKAKTLIG